jgi:hypothetical protein
VGPTKGLEVPLTREEYRDWYLGRRERDFLSSRNKPKAEKPKADEKDKEKDKDKAKAESKPFTDKQLDKAIATLSEKLAPKK